MRDPRTFWTQLLQRTLAEYADDNCGQFAAAIAYHVLFSVFPLVIMLAAIFGIVVHLTGVQANLIDAIGRNVPLSSSGEARLRTLLKGTTGGLSAVGLVGVVGLLYSASGMMASVRVALGAAWDCEQSRPFLRGKLIDVGLVFATAAGALGSIGLTIGVRFVAGGGWATFLLGVAAPFGYALVVVFLLYRLIPPCRVATRDAIGPAAAVAAVFVAAENLFAVYVRHFGNYNAIYGSLGAVVAFMFFVYLSATLFLLGAEAASELPRIRRAIELDEIEDGPPLPVQARDFLVGLWVQRRQEEGAKQEERVERAD
jgi:membrane protein